MLSRRTLLARTALLGAALPAGRALADTDDAGASHFLASLGGPTLAEGFTAFPWVNPEAPTGGEVTLSAVGTFDNFNPFIVRGQSPFDFIGIAEASRESAWTLVFDTLFTTNPDETEIAYPRLARAVRIAPDRRSVRFFLDPRARFSDGTAITAQDVVWSFDILRAKGSPLYRLYWADVAEAIAEEPREVLFRFSTAANRELPVILGQVPVLPRAFWAGREFDRPLTEPPPSSGPYRIGHFAFGRSLTLERVADWWGRALPSARGRYNIDHIHTEFFRDATVAMEAFKAGQIDLRQENIAKDWATAYDFPAVAKGWVKREALPHRLPMGMQGWAMNTRRTVFADRRVRQAMALAFDFEWANANLFYGAYTRTESYFSNSDLAATGLPEGAELALLEPWRGKVPEEVFTTPFKLPKTDGTGNNRAGLRAALALLEQAGWTVKERRLVDGSGAPMQFEILLNQPSLERVALPYQQWLGRLGITASVRSVDPAQYQRRLNTYDYDMTMVVIPEPDSPGNEQTALWSSGAAEAEGGENLMGVRDPAVDALVRAVIAAPDRTAQLAATRALDRVLLWGWYTVPNWYLRSVWVAHWDRLGRPQAPVRPGVVFDSWWIDPARDAALKAARAAG